MNTISKNKKLVFISYSHKEPQWKDKLVEYLTLYKQEHYFDIWVDDKIRGGEEWEKEIHTAITNADVAILLISNNFLISKYIRETELPLIQNQFAKGLVIYPIIVSDCDWSEWKCLSERQCRFNNMPLDKLSSPDLSTALKQSAIEIKEIIHTNQSESKKTLSKPSLSSPAQIKSNASKELPQWLEAALFVFTLLLMCIMTLSITYNYFPEYVSNITFQKKAFTVSGAAAFIIFMIVLFKIFASTALTYMKIRNEMKILIIFLSIIPFCSIFSISASAYMLDIPFINVVLKIVLSETDDTSKKSDNSIKNDKSIKNNHKDGEDEVFDKTSPTRQKEKKYTPEQKVNKFLPEKNISNVNVTPGKRQKNKEQVKKILNPQNSEVIVNSLDMKFVKIKAGSFFMGSPEDEPTRFSNESRHKVTLTNDFYMQTTEVTQGQWIDVMGDNPSRFKECGKNCPVENVSWHDVKNFIKKLNVIDAIENEYSYRLPTEAEWEYAARAGTTTRFSWGDEEDCLKANYGSGWSDECKGQNPGKTMKVASFQPNSWGLYDMHGNVWEWCEDSYTETLVNDVDPFINNDSGLRVIRGGSWNFYAGFCRSAFRFRDGPGNRDGNLGLRLVFSRGQ
ncbi:membrane protein containing Sulphatase-modifying factor domain protein [Candidatus Magnetomorum sp. HK-1]|nr:membrane protein containing Sulphatase-modifying factor domain protein [Candidatus Magnetomorum sp. HK-1]